MAISVLNEANYLQKLPVFGRFMVQALLKLQDGMNNGFQNIAINPTGKIPPPAPLQAVNVKASGGLVHVTLVDNSQMQKGKQYFVEYDTDPNFSQPHVEDLGASRGRILNIPGMTDEGTPQNFYFRGYSQYHGSKAGEKVNFGSKYNPTPVQSGGDQTLTPLPSTGSGTALANGQQGGQGLGDVFFRPATLNRVT
jgi:hypothetical protein